MEDQQVKNLFLIMLTSLSLVVIGCDNDKGGGDRVAVAPAGTPTQCQNAIPNGYNYGYNGNQVGCENYNNYFNGYMNNGLWANNNNVCQPQNGQQTYPLQIGGAWYCGSYHYFMNNWGVNPASYYQANAGFYFRTYYPNNYYGGSYSYNYGNNCEDDNCYDGGDLLAAGAIGLGLGYLLSH